MGPVWPHLTPLLCSAANNAPLLPWLTLSCLRFCSHRVPLWGISSHDYDDFHALLCSRLPSLSLPHTHTHTLIRLCLFAEERGCTVGGSSKIALGHPASRWHQGNSLAAEMAYDPASASCQGRWAGVPAHSSQSSRRGCPPRPNGFIYFPPSPSWERLLFPSHPISLSTFFASRRFFLPLLLLLHSFSGHSPRATVQASGLRPFVDEFQFSHQKQKIHIHFCQRALDRSTILN
ncbi:hypothetical protein F5884DRAFT_485142 [Xylogone sp. PMI_703]|nr:hypothetical protein F5884DRAFT_485142 [Xylogone sp. PMI_703]